MATVFNKKGVNVLSRTLRMRSGSEGPSYDPYEYEKYDRIKGTYYSRKAMKTLLDMWKVDDIRKKEAKCDAC